MSQRRISAPGFLFALLALVAQLLSGAVVQRTEAAAALGDATTICHAHETSDEAPPVQHHPSDCLICPLCVSLSSTAFALSAHSALPAPRVIVAARAFILPLATAPPATIIFAARPRGPPTILT
jgi:hypothetical protein